MGNIPFLMLLGSLSVLGNVYGLSLEMIVGIVGTALGVFALVKADTSERLLRQISGELGKIGELREELRTRLAPRGRLASLLRRLFRS
jgi:hypothetical protein